MTRIPVRASFAFVERLGREGALKRDVAEAFARAGIDLELSVAQAVRELADALDATLCRAQDARAVRADIGVDDVIAAVAGAAFAISQSKGDADRARVVLAVICDGLRDGLTAVRVRSVRLRSSACSQAPPIGHDHQPPLFVA